MCDKIEQLDHHCEGPGRRSFLKATSVATALGLVGGSVASAPAHADALTQSQRDKMTPDQTAKLLKEIKRMSGGDKAPPSGWRPSASQLRDPDRVMIERKIPVERGRWRMLPKGLEGRK